MLSIILDLPSELEIVLKTKAQNQGLSMPDFLLQLARKEAESGSYTLEEMHGFFEADVLPVEISKKFQRLRGKQSLQRMLGIIVPERF